MNQDNYTSLELSKKLAENGCELESEIYHGAFPHGGGMQDFGMHQGRYGDGFVPNVPAYDILNDICCRYAVQFFGDGQYYAKFHGSSLRECTCENNVLEIMTTADYMSYQIIKLLQQGKKQEAEDYIWEHCLFNPKNH